jgi:Fur family ferric uptake transcriptional regulator
MKYAREHGLRRTKSLEKVVHTLLHQPKPSTWNELCKMPEVKCDRVTVYRQIGKLVDIGLVRKLGFHERSAYYMIAMPDEHHDYLICTECGSLSDLNWDCPLETFEKKVQNKSGFAELHHELSFYGVCPKCQKS